MINIDNSNIYHIYSNYNKMLWPDKAKKILAKFKIEKLKDPQYNAINELLSGNDVIVLMETGGGKSLCYQLPPLIVRKVMFVISPLISLMEDQKNKLLSLGIPCATLHNENDNKYDEIKEIINGKIRIVYMSPEYLAKVSSNSDEENEPDYIGGISLAKQLIELNMLGFLAVDESHCCSSWGHDFRPKYKDIKIFREMFPEIPIIAVTATATDIVCNDIKKMLQLNDPVIVKESFDRPNLYLKVILPTKELSKQYKITRELEILPYLKKYSEDKIIIYVDTIKDTETLSLKLNKLIKDCCKPYYAKLDHNIKEQTQNDFSNGKIKIIVCTTAFGLGIDQTVKCVIISGCPSSVEDYYQQIGRAGRTGIHCETIFFFDHYKLISKKAMILKDFGNTNMQLFKVKDNNIEKVKEYAYITTCRRKYILEYFNEMTAIFNCNNCDNCCEQDMVDITDIVMRKDFTNIKNKYIKYSYIVDKNIKDWLIYIRNNKIQKENILENLKIKIPRKFLIEEKKVENNFDNNFDKTIDRYEKILEL